MAFEKSAGTLLLSFVMATKRDYEIGWFHRELAKELQIFYKDVQQGKSPRLMITVPPRHGKSQLASMHFPAWTLGKDPTLPIIWTSFSSSLALDINREVQRIMSSEEYHRIFPRSALSPKKKKGEIRRADFFEIPEFGGKFLTAGVGGAITGKGAKILGIDDPIKNREEANSITIRNKIWDWYTSTAYTRLAPGGGVLLIQTRWHEDDLAGRLIEAMKAECGDTFRVVNYPAIAEQDEFHRKAGEALHPERYSLAQLTSMRRTIGEFDWAALYQQHPAPVGGAIFKSEWLRFYNIQDLPQKFDEKIQSWDFTFKDSAGADNVCGTVWGVKGPNIFLLDLVCEKMNFTKSVAAIRAMTNKHPDAFVKLVEDKANGTAIIDYLRKEIPGMIPITPTESKLTRANAVTPAFEAGNVWLPATTLYKWVSPYLTEMQTFPSAAHDDQVDSTTQAIKYLVKKIERQSIWS